MLSDHRVVEWAAPSGNMGCSVISLLTIRHFVLISLCLYIVVPCSMNCTANRCYVCVCVCANYSKLYGVFIYCVCLCLHTRGVNHKSHYDRILYRFNGQWFNVCQYHKVCYDTISIWFDSRASDPYETVSPADLTPSLPFISVHKTATKISLDIFIPELKQTFKWKIYSFNESIHFKEPHSVILSFEENWKTLNSCFDIV